MELTDIGSYSSIFGVILTVGVAIGTFVINRKVKELKGKLLMKETLPKLIEDLDSNKSKIIGLYAKYDQSINEIRHEVAHSIVILNNISRKIPPGSNIEIAKVIKKAKSLEKSKFIESYNSKSNVASWKFWIPNEADKEDIWDFYTQLSTSQTDLNYLFKDYIKFN